MFSCLSSSDLPSDIVPSSAACWGYSFNNNNIYRVGESGFNCWGFSWSALVILMWMYMKCTCGLACPSRLWQYQLPRFSSASCSLSPWFHPEWLPPVSLWGTGRVSWNSPLSLHSYFCVFSSLFASPNPPQQYNFWTAACWGYSSIIILIYMHFIYLFILL